MTLICLELSHWQASVKLREQVSFSSAQLQQTYTQCKTDWSMIKELVILSTCNRTELIATSADSMYAGHDLSTQLLALLAQSQNVDPTLITDHATWHFDEQVVTHLCRVAAGLESQLIGESEILGQVERAHELASQHQANGPTLKKLFQTAIRAGKRARTETGIGHHATSVGTVAVRLAQGALGDLRHKRVAVVGCGAMAQVVVHALRSADVSEITILNRTPANARPLAEKFGLVATGLTGLVEMMQTADVIITATASPVPIITAEQVNLALVERADPLLLVDISVPRNIEPIVAEIDTVTLFDMDALGQVRDNTIAERKRAIPAVNAIIETETIAYHEAIKTMRVEPTIGDLYQRAEGIRQRELERVLRHLPDLDPVTYEQMQKFSRSLVSKLFHEPTMQLRRAAQQEDGEQYDATLRDLFQL